MSLTPQILNSERNYNHTQHQDVPREQRYMYLCFPCVCDISQRYEERKKTRRVLYVQRFAFQRRSVSSSPPERINVPFLYVQSSTSSGVRRTPHRIPTLLVFSLIERNVFLRSRGSEEIDDMVGFPPFFLCVVLCTHTRRRHTTPQCFDLYVCLIHILTNKIRIK